MRFQKIAQTCQSDPFLMVFGPYLELSAPDGPGIRLPHQKISVALPALELPVLAPRQLLETEPHEEHGPPRPHELQSRGRRETDNKNLAARNLIVIQSIITYRSLKRPWGVPSEALWGP